MIFQLLLLGKLKIREISKKNIYKKNSIQKILTRLVAKYTKILRKVSEISDSIYWKKLIFIS